eukprot:4687707-Amphidinium_carterae.2
MAARTACLTCIRKSARGAKKVSDGLKSVGQGRQGGWIAKGDFQSSTHGPQQGTRSRAWRRLFGLRDDLAIEWFVRAVTQPQSMESMMEIEGELRHINRDYPAKTWASSENIDIAGNDWRDTENTGHL